MNNRQAMGRRSKQRGNTLETQTAAQFSEWTGHTFRRTPASGAWSASEQFGVDADVITPWNEWRWIIECKFYNASNWTIENLLNNTLYFPKWVAQAVREGQGADAPFMLVFRRNRIHPFVLMPYNDKLARLFSTYIVTNVQYTSEVTGLLENIRTITVTMDELLQQPFTVFTELGNKDTWQKQIVSQKPVKAKASNPDKLLKQIEGLGL